MHKPIFEIAVGLFVVAGLAALLFQSIRVGSFNGDSVDDPYTVHAYFDNIGGLKVRAPVTMAGVNIGRIRSIKLDSDTYRAAVELSISGDYSNLPLDTSAAINTQGLLGEQYIALEPGGDPAFLKDGDRIRLTQSAIVLENMIGQFLFGGKGE
jgi:phospholipid/cholesterol/gamma-HCH transport system substrate-binding protein